MTGSLSAGIAWAVPVKPDVLGAHLEAYEKAFPVLNALRLCHRFGQGPNAHLTRLPVELEQAIEDFVLIAGRSPRSGWQTDFSCFECTCEPSGHSALYWDEDIHDDIDFCESCVEDGMDDTGCDNRCVKADKNICDVCKDEPGLKICMRTCLAAYNDIMNDVAFESDYYFEEHTAHGDAWESRVAQGKEGDFVKYDKILGKHFGLEAYFAHTRHDTSSKHPWPTHVHSRWHEECDRRTTLCYLTLPKKFGPSGTFNSSEMEVQGGYISLPCAQALRIDLPSLVGTDKMRTRFQRAMRILGLKASPHPSQVSGDIVAAQRPANDTDDDSIRETKAKSGNGDSNTQWPQLTLLVNADFHDG